MVLFGNILNVIVLIFYAYFDSTLGSELIPCEGMRHKGVHRANGVECDLFVNRHTEGVPSADERALKRGSESGIFSISNEAN